MKKKKRMIIISGFIIMLCMVEFIIGFYCKSRANSRVANNTIQVAIAEADTVVNISTEAEIEEGSSETETDENATNDTKSIKATDATDDETEAMTEMEESVSEPTRAPYIGSEYSITCWGDSLTEGTGSWTKTVPSTLEDLTNIKTYNMGVYGEDSREIACRQGGLKMYVNNITIPASGEVRFSEILCDGNPISLWDNVSDFNYLNDHSDPYGLTACFDNCSIAGIIGKLTYDYNTDEYIFTRAEDEKPPEPETEPKTEPEAEPDTQTSDKVLNQTTTAISSKDAVIASTKAATEGVSITSPTEIIIPVREERRNDILILEMGNNGGYDDDYSILVEQYQAMINYSYNGYYIIVGDTDYPEYVREDWENALQNAFGDHFFNMRQYLVDFAANGGLDDYNITMNQDDLDCIDRGEVPYCLKIWDQTHLNATGYEIEGRAIYEKGLELGYWVE